MSNWHPPAFLDARDLIWKHRRRHWCKRVVVLNGTSLNNCIIFKRVFWCSFTQLVATLVELQTIIESRQHTDCAFKRLLKVPAKICRSFQYLDFFVLFLDMSFCNFEAKIARFIKLYAQWKWLIKCFLGLTTHLKGFLYR